MLTVIPQYTVVTRTDPFWWGHPLTQSLLMGDPFYKDLFF
jgi:hypothetical protein